MVDYLQHGTFDDNMIPTVGFSMRKVNKGKVAIKVWDMGGQVGMNASRINWLRSPHMHAPPETPLL